MRRYFYGLWKYAQVFEGESPSIAKEIFDNSEERLQLPPSDAYLLENVHVHNAYIAGYLGYIELGKLAYPDGNWDNSSEQQELDRLLNLRATGFSNFQAKALIFGQPREELVKYLDVPAFERGDLFHIQNLIVTIQAARDFKKVATPSFGYQGNAITYTLSFLGNHSTLTLTDTLSTGVSAPGNFWLEGTSVMPDYDSDQHRLTWSDTPPAGQEVTISYTITITTSDHRALTNTAELSEAGAESSTAMATVIVNPYLTYLPLILKDN